MSGDDRDYRRVSEEAMKLMSEDQLAEPGGSAGTGESGTPGKEDGAA